MKLLEKKPKFLQKKKFINFSFFLLKEKSQDKRDLVYEKKIMIWIEEVIGEKCEFPQDLPESLKSGVILCK